MYCASKKSNLHLYGETSNFLAEACARSLIEVLFGVDMVFIGVISSSSPSSRGNPSLSTTFCCVLFGVAATCCAPFTGDGGLAKRLNRNEIKNSGDTSKMPRPPPMMTALIKGSSVTPNW